MIKTLPNSGQRHKGHDGTLQHNPEFCQMDLMSVCEARGSGRSVRTAVVGPGWGLRI